VPAVGNGLVYVGSANRNLYAFDAATGAVGWSAPTGGAISSSPALAHGMAFVGSDDLYAFDATTGVKRWSTTTGADFGASPAVANGVVYVGSGGSFSAFREATGAPILSRSTGCSQDPVVIADGTVYALWCGDLFALALPPGATGVAATRPR
jgi:outer membrane protein assembly factor BamB